MKNINFALDDVKDGGEAIEMLCAMGIIPFSTAIVEHQPFIGTINHLHGILQERLPTAADVATLRKLEKQRKDMLGWRVVRDLFER